jgi:histidinol-phosphate phosphatase family protein
MSERDLPDSARVGGRRKAVLLDRDGTLVEHEPYLHDPAKVVLRPGAGAALRHFRDAGYALVVVTNQSGVGRGYFPIEAMHAVHKRLQALLAAEEVTLDAIYYCPHAPDEGCDCRKPATGMAERAAQELGLDLTRSVMIGDMALDMAFGRRIGATTVLVADTVDPAAVEQADHVVAALGEAVALLKLDAAATR